MGEAPRTRETQEKPDAVSASKIVTRNARREATKRFSGGTVKLLGFLSIPFMISVASSLTLGTSWWGPAAAIMAAEYGFPIFGRLLGSQFAIDDFTSVSDWWDAMIRHYKKERVDLGKWVFEGEIEIKEKPQQQGASPQIPQG